MKAIRFPTPPVFDFAPKTNWYIRDAKIQIAEISQLFAVSVTALKHDSPPTTDSLGDRTELYGIDERRCGIGQSSGHKALC
ncbi:MAG: hypothetical protein DME71_06140 [Verrucomicrobia bacterium]|nr:MAG: hypothetical protein DME71_06140 [Verrucomicrobiota bacterium]